MALGWSGATPLSGQLKCARKSVNLTGLDTIINLSLTQANCDDDFFSLSTFRGSGLTNPLRLIDCLDTTAVSPNSNCDASARGSAGSYRVKLIAHPEVSISTLSAQNFNQSLSLQADCITSATYPASITTTNLRIPYGSLGFNPSTVIEVFSDGACSTNKKIFSFPHGTYGNETTPSTATTLSSSSSGDVFLEFGCPYGYIPVVSNPVVGTTSDFCVMKFEAKNVTGLATSQAALTPWVSISQINAKTACTTLGSKYDLISNPEWMSVAYDVEATASNWSTGVVGTGALFRGHSDVSPNSALGVTNTADPYSGTGNTAAQVMGSGREQKRTFTLSNGEVIWDLAGNVWEWTDWTLGGALVSGPTICNSAWTEFPLVSCGALSANDYMPGNPTVVVAANYNTNYGLGT